MDNSTGIDFVITWVDGNDPEWQSEKRKYSGEGCDDRPERYRDWEFLRYWFRGVEKFAPWVRKIYFVTWGHLPEWLDTNHPKIHIVRHEDYIPKEYLPTFNSHVIEFHLHRIQGLSERFVYFNDDMFLTDKVFEEDFFAGEYPKDMLAFQPVVTNPQNPVMPYLYLNNAMVLAKYFDKRANVKKQPSKYFHIGYPPMYFIYNILELAFPRFTGFFTAHGPFPLNRSTFELAWSKEEELLTQTSSHKFRSKEDVTPYLLREWKKLLGEFEPCNLLKNFAYFDVKDDNRRLAETIRKQKAKILCINDANETINFERAKKEIDQAFATIFPERSSFEKM